MSETRKSSPYGRQPTPPPQPTPKSETPTNDSTEPSPPPSENNEIGFLTSLIEAENTALKAENAERLRQVESLSAQVISLSQQASSLSQLLAEQGMAEISDQQWVDLRRSATTAYRPGHYTLTIPRVEEDLQNARVTLTWTPGALLLCESYRRQEDNTLELTLPPARQTEQHWMVPPLDPASLPQATGTYRDTQLHVARVEVWQQHCQPEVEAGEHARAAGAARVEEDEKTLLYEAMRLVQERRTNPQGEPGVTIYAALEEIASQMRAQAHDLSSSASAGG